MGSQPLALSDERRTEPREEGSSPATGTERGGELTGDLRRGGNRGGVGACCGQENGEEGRGWSLIAEGAGEGLEEMARVM
jgi:hypothetical protein